MKKTNKFLLIVISFILISSLLIGCSGSKATLTSVDEDFAFSYGIDNDAAVSSCNSDGGVNLGEPACPVSHEFLLQIIDTCSHELYDRDGTYDIMWHALERYNAMRLAMYANMAS